MLTRIEFESATSGKIIVYPNGITVPWVALDGIYYYLT